MRWPLRDICLAGVVLSVACFCLGCGTGEYEERLEQQIGNLQKGSVFEQLYALAPLEGTSILARVPKVFQQSLKEGSVVDGHAVDPRRVKPPVVDLVGGLKITYEAFVTDSDGTQKSYYLYLVAIEKNEADKACFAAQARDSTLRSTGTLKMHRDGKLYRNLNRAFPGTISEWKDVQCPAFDGHKVTWQKVRVTGKQEFYCIDQNKQPRYSELPGAIEFYVHQEGDFLVVLIWRVPTSIESQAALAELAPLVAGSVSSK